MKRNVKLPTSVWKSLRPRQVIRHLCQVYADSHRKPLPQILAEYLRVVLKTRGLASHYFSSYLYHRDVDNITDYLAFNEMRDIQKAFLDNGLADEILGNKLLFQKHFTKCLMPLPRLLAYNLKHRLFFTDTDSVDVCDIRTPDSMRDVLARLLAASTNQSVFLKPIRGSCGAGVHRVSSRSAEPVTAEINEIHECVSAGCFLFQDEVVQHQELARLYSGSLNTIRIDTFTEPGVTPEILSAYLRLGKDGSAVDNISAGGIFVSVDLDSGTLGHVGRRILYQGGGRYTAHPNTGVPFRGFRVPLFEGVKQLARQAATCVPACLAAWDVAVSTRGPILVEGNWYYGMETADTAYGGYRRNPVFRKVIDNIEKMNSRSRARP